MLAPSGTEALTHEYPLFLTDARFSVVSCLWPMFVLQRRRYRREDGSTGVDDSAPSCKTFGLMWRRWGASGDCIHVARRSLRFARFQRGDSLGHSTLSSVFVSASAYASTRCQRSLRSDAGSSPCNTTLERVRRPDLISATREPRHGTGLARQIECFRQVAWDWSSRIQYFLTVI